MLTDIIVHMDRGAGCTARLMAAIDLASRHGGRLKGLYVITHPHYTSSSSYLSDFAQVREFFVNATSKAGIEAEWLLVDWNTVGTPLAEIVTNHSHYADTILVGQPTQLHSRRTNLDFHERLILGAGRPIVVFPGSGDIFQFGERVLVAWKAGRESVRAVNDALPFLQAATDISIVAMVTSHDNRAREEQPINLLQQHLARHHVKAATEIIVIQKGNAAEALLEQARQKKADLIVVGGFSYKSNRAPVLSPFTQELLLKAPVPLLISH
ncbi:universal stress protein [Trichlorobacter lovleyi]|uniref:universal stress protein n=1 Tax=Trichlorobacter lovleyi TaxID=313985 RepID=UPI0023F3CC16|nr:universal stress protein [Trichlorobacter lovleyi]